jgi:hypothetical protein
LYSCITFPIFFYAFGPYLRRLLLELPLDFFAAEDRERPREELDFRAVAMGCPASFVIRRSGA